MSRTRVFVLTLLAMTAFAGNSLLCRLALKDTRIDYAWGGTLAITMNRMPCFTRPAPNMLSASGYSGHGVAMATLAGKILAEAVAAQSERFDLMASLPQPRFPGGAGLRWPLLVTAMTWYAMRDRLGL